MEVIPPGGLLHCEVTPVNAQEPGLPADPATANSEACAYLTNVSTGWNLLYAPTPAQAAIRRSPRTGISSRSDTTVSTEQVWVCDSSGELVRETLFCPGQGFWVAGGATRTGATLFLGRQAPDAGPQNGWNVIGVTEETDVADFTVSGFDVTSIWSWDDQTRVYRAISLDAGRLLPGTGYWATLKNQ